MARYLEKGIADITNYTIGEAVEQGALDLLSGFDQYSNDYALGYDELGFINFGKIAKGIGKGLKKVGRGIGKGLKAAVKVAAKVAATVGPAVSIAFPAMAPGILAATAMLNAVDSGNPEAIAKQAAITAGAATGRPEFQKAAGYIEIAKTAKRQVVAASTLVQAKGGAPDALARIMELRAVASAPNASPAVREAYAALEKAAVGLKLAQAEGQKIT
jgi:hypothetical protein